MPCRYEIDVRRRLVRTHYSGNLTFTDMEANRLRMISDPAFCSDFFQLADYRDVTEFRITGEEVRLLASNPDFSPNSRRAAVFPSVGQPVGMGLGRMFEIYRELTGGKEKIGLFTSMEDAERWIHSEG